MTQNGATGRFVFRLRRKTERKKERGPLVIDEKRGPSCYQWQMVSPFLVFENSNDLKNWARRKVEKPSLALQKRVVKLLSRWGSEKVIKRVEGASGELSLPGTWSHRNLCSKRFFQRDKSFRLWIRLY